MKPFKQRFNSILTLVKSVTTKYTTIRILLYVVFIQLLLPVNGCNDEILLSRRISEPVKVDANLADWTENTFVSMENDSILLAAANDDRYYYLAGKILDRRIGRAFAVSGMMLVINPDGEQEKNLQMDFTFPGTKHININKGGFFQALDETEKDTLLKNLQPLLNGVSVIDTSTLRSLVFTDSANADFQGKMAISDNQLLFELKIPIQIAQYFSEFKSLDANSMFCLRPGTVRRFERMRGFRGRGGFAENETDDFTQWFRIKANAYE
jgi:hypothetical protein